MSIRFLTALTRPATEPDWITVDEFRQRSWQRATRAALVYLEAHSLEVDPDAARRLAFGLWLRASGRLDGEFTLTRDGAPGVPGAMGAGTGQSGWVA